MYRNGQLPLFKPTTAGNAPRPATSSNANTALLFRMGYKDKVGRRAGNPRKAEYLSMWFISRCLTYNLNFFYKPRLHYTTRRQDPVPLVTYLINGHSIPGDVKCPKLCSMDPETLGSIEGSINS